MRCALVLVVLTGCAGSAGNGPAWPKAHDAEADGGESLAPHTAKTVATLGVGVDEDETKPASTAAVPVAAAATAEGSGAPAVTTTPADEVINTEEIIIEIDE